MTATEDPGGPLVTDERAPAPADLVVVQDGAPVEPTSGVSDLAIGQEPPLAVGRPVAVVEGAVESVKTPVPGPAIARLARFLVVCADALGVVGAMAGSHLVLAPLYLDAPGADANAYRRMAMVALPFWIMIFRRYRLYDARRITGRRDEVVRVIHAVGVSTLVTALVGYFLHLQVERSRFLMLFAAAVVTVLVERELVRYNFGVLRRRGHCLRRVAIAGTGPEALAMVRAFQEHPELGYAVVALLGDPAEVPPDLSDRLRVLQLQGSLVEELRLAGAAGVVVATTDVDTDTSNRLIRMLTDAGIHVELSSSLRDIDATRLSVHPLGRFSMLYVEPVKRGGWRPVAKRAFDIALSAVMLIVASPLLALAALAVKLTSPGPIFFTQERIGYRGRVFRILKLRTMCVDADSLLKDTALQASEGLVKVRRDPRVTPVGRVLRRLSVDELPQLANVLVGQMSLVGPRPQLLSEVALWTPEVFERLRVRPGLTGMWQVTGRSQAREAKDRWDLYYVDNWSVWRDLAILLKTVPVVISSKGAY